ncbi:MAG TPA: hypothetical protein VHT73_02075 [Thermodesulfobacteriota bacterium]|nr:hypothetical protein [Thermodesulfobacteriota bacterium]
MSNDKYIVLAISQSCMDVAREKRNKIRFASHEVLVLVANIKAYNSLW